MKRFIILGILAQLGLGSAFAQHEGAVLVKSDTVRGAVYDKVATGIGGEVVDNSKDPRARYNWFVDGAIGAGFYAAEGNRIYQNPMSRMRTAAQITVGKWILPHWAVRYSFGYGKFVGEYEELDHYYYNAFEQTDHSMPAEMTKDVYHDAVLDRDLLHRKFQVIDNQLDMMYDLNSLFTKRKTPLDINIYGGIGYAYCLKSQGLKGCGSLSFKAGLDAHYNVTDHFYIKGVIEGTICDESLDGMLGGFSSDRNRTVEGYMQAMIGVGVNFGHKATRKYTYVGTDNIERTYKVPATVEAEDYSAPFVVRFFIDQYNVESDQEVNIAKVCKYLQQHPNARLLMTGHADPETATAKYNQALSERRCNSVLKYIDQHYGISHDRIEVKPMGDTQNNFSEDFRWNRCVILQIIDK